MLLIDSSPVLSPAQMVALDDLLLDKTVSGDLAPWLRLWESPHTFVVLGRHGKPAEECHLDRCRADSIPILRRPSGGGTVLQGPGCLNFSLVLDTRTDARLQDVRESYQVVLGRVAAALQTHGIPAEVACCVDVAVAGMKISGNAQLRRRGFLLHHGTLLCGFDLAGVNCYLKHPPREPPYRRGRAHGEFIRNLGLDIESAAELLRTAWGPFSGTWRAGENDLDRLEEITRRMGVEF